MTKKRKENAAAGWIEGELRLAGMLDNRIIELLKAIQENGSINQAAKTLGLSYKGAWQMLERANNGAPQSLLTTATGGSKGGGTVLSPAGMALLSLFSRLEHRHREFIAELNRSLSEDPATVLLLQRLEVKTSTRNQLFGAVTAIERSGSEVRIAVRLKGGESVAATLSSEHLAGSKIETGSDAVLMINSSDIVLSTDPAIVRIADGNCLQGKVLRIQHDIADTEVIVLLSSGEILAAMITEESLEKLGLIPGIAVWAAFSARAPILGIRSE